jgi:hypothetical protein
LEEFEESLRPTSDPELARKAMADWKKTQPLRLFLARNWDNLQKQYPGKTVLLWLEKGRIRAREHCRGPRSPTEVFLETEGRGLPDERLSIYVPRLNKPQSGG